MCKCEPLLRSLETHWVFFVFQLLCIRGRHSESSETHWRLILFGTFSLVSVALFTHSHNWMFECFGAIKSCSGSVNIKLASLIMMISYLWTQQWGPPSWKVNMEKNDFQNNKLVKVWYFCQRCVLIIKKSRSWPWLPLAWPFPMTYLYLLQRWRIIMK